MGSDEQRIDGFLNTSNEHILMISSRGDTINLSNTFKLEVTLSLSMGGPQTSQYPVSGRAPHITQNMTAGTYRLLNGITWENQNSTPSIILMPNLIFL